MLPEDPLLTVAQTAARLATGPHYVRRLVHTKRLRYIKLDPGQGGLLRFRASDVDDFVAARTVEVVA